MEPNWYSLPDYLIEQFPSLRAEIEESYFSRIEGGGGNPYPHVFIAEILGTLLYGQRPEASADDRSHAGQILDQLLTCPDQDLSSAALTTIVEALRDVNELREASWPFLGPVAQKWITNLLSDQRIRRPN